MSSPDLARLRREIQEAASLPDATERLLEVAAVIAEAVADLRAQPVVVGGLALAYWSDGAFLTGDIDVLMLRPPELPQRLVALGFERLGREWELQGFGISFEAPGETLGPGEEALAVELASGRRLSIMSLEDLLLWRLREWLHWHAVSGFEQAAQLHLAAVLDTARLDRRAADEGLALALRELRSLMDEIEAGRTFEVWELSEIGKRLERASYGGRHE